MSIPSGNAVADKSVKENSQEYVFYSKDFVTGEEGYETIEVNSNTVYETEGCITDYGDDDGISPASIIGDDESYEIIKTHEAPYRAICDIRTYWDKNGDGAADIGYLGSGCMVGRSVVLTCGHILHRPDAGNCVKVEVYPARQRYYTPYGPYKAKKVFANCKYVQNMVAVNDWGVIILNANAGDITGWLGLKNCKDTDLSGSDVSVIGYPGNKDKYRITMWRSDGKVVADINDFLYYDCDTLPGNSGSPVIDSENKIVAVHAYGSTNHNFGAKVQNEIYGTIAYMRSTYD